jgi:hypothetical protein
MPTLANEPQDALPADPDADAEGEVVTETPLFQPTNMQEVLPRLFIGDYRASQDFDELRRHGIGHIIAASEFAPGVFALRCA